MTEINERPPTGVGEGAAVPEPQGELLFKGGENHRIAAPRISSRGGKTNFHASFRVGKTRYSGPTPYDDEELACAFGSGAFAVATAIHDRLGPQVVALVLGGKVGIVRFKATPSPSARPARTTTAAYAHLGPMDEVWVAPHRPAPDVDRD